MVEKTLDPGTRSPEQKPAPIASVELKQVGPQAAVAGGIDVSALDARAKTLEERAKAEKFIKGLDGDGLHHDGLNFKFKVETRGGRPVLDASIENPSNPSERYELANTRVVPVGKEMGLKFELKKGGKRVAEGTIMRGEAGDLFAGMNPVEAGREETGNTLLIDDRTWDMGAKDVLLPFHKMDINADGYTIRCKIDETRQDGRLLEVSVRDRENQTRLTAVDNLQIRTLGGDTGLTFDVKTPDGEPMAAGGIWKTKGGFDVRVRRLTSE